MGRLLGTTPTNENQLLSNLAHINCVARTNFGAIADGRGPAPQSGVVFVDCATHRVVQLDARMIVVSRVWSAAEPSQLSDRCLC